MSFIRPTIDQSRPQMSTLELAMEEIRRSEIPLDDPYQTLLAAKIKRALDKATPEGYNTADWMTNTVEGRNALRDVMQSDIDLSKVKGTGISPAAMQKIQQQFGGMPTTYGGAMQLLTQSFFPFIRPLATGAMNQGGDFFEAFNNIATGIMQGVLSYDPNYGLKNPNGVRASSPVNYLANQGFAAQSSFQKHWLTNNQMGGMSFDTPGGENLVDDSGNTLPFGQYSQAGYLTHADLGAAPVIPEEIRNSVWQKITQAAESQLGPAGMQGWTAAGNEAALSKIVQMPVQLSPEERAYFGNPDAGNLSIQSLMGIMDETRSQDVYWTKWQSKLHNLRRAVPNQGVPLPDLFSRTGDLAISDAGNSMDLFTGTSVRGNDGKLHFFGKPVGGGNLVPINELQQVVLTPEQLGSTYNALSLGKVGSSADRWRCAVPQRWVCSCWVRSARIPGGEWRGFRSCLHPGG